MEKSVPSTSNEATQQEASANADNAQGRGAGITAAQMKKALDEINHPTYVAKVNISEQDINNAKDGLRDVTSLAFECIARIMNLILYIFHITRNFQKLPSVFRRLYKEKGWMMLEDIKVSDFPKNPMPVPEHVKNWKLVWEKVPPPQEKLVVRGLLNIYYVYLFHF